MSKSFKERIENARLREESLVMKTNDALDTALAALETARATLSNSAQAVARSDAATPDAELTAMLRAKEHATLRLSHAEAAVTKARFAVDAAAGKAGTFQGMVRIEAQAEAIDRIKALHAEADGLRVRLAAITAEQHAVFETDVRPMMPWHQPGFGLKSPPGYYESVDALLGTVAPPPPAFDYLGALLPSLKGVMK